MQELISSAASADSTKSAAFAEKLAEMETKHKNLLAERQVSLTKAAAKIHEMEEKMSKAKATAEQQLSEEGI